MTAAATYDLDATPQLRLVCLVALAVLLGAGALRRRAQNRRRREWTLVTGTVTGWRDSGSGAGDTTTMTKVVEFTTATGETIDADARNGVDLGFSAQGRRIPIWYDPADPRRFEVQVHRLDRAGSVLFLVAVPFGALLGVTFLPLW